MYFLVPKNLHLGRGKIGSQVAHAAFGLAQQMSALQLADTLSSNNAIIVLYVDDNSQLSEYETLAQASKLNTSRILDEGVTQCPPGSTTCLGIGPMTDKVGRAMFRKLKLIS